MMDLEDVQGIKEIVAAQQPEGAEDLIASGYFENEDGVRRNNGHRDYERTMAASNSVGSNIHNDYFGWDGAGTLREDHLAITIKDGQCIEVVEVKKETQLYRGTEEKWVTYERKLPNQVVTFIFEDEYGHKQTFSGIGGSETLLYYWMEYCYDKVGQPLNVYDTLGRGQFTTSSGKVIKVSVVTSDGQPIHSIPERQMGDYVTWYDGRYTQQYVTAPPSEGGTPPLVVEDDTDEPSDEEEPSDVVEPPITIDPIESTYGDFYLDQLKTYNENYDSAKTKTTAIVNKFIKVYDSFNGATGADIDKIRTDLTTIIDSLNTTKTKVSTKQQKTNDNADSCRRCYKKWFFKQYDAYIDVHINQENGRVAAYKYKKDDTEHEPKDRKGDYLEATIEEMLNS